MAWKHQAYIISLRITPPMYLLFIPSQKYVSDLTVAIQESANAHFFP